MKKIISVFLIIMMLIPSAVVMNVAAEENYGDGAGLLMALGIINDEYDPEAPITKYDATVVAMKIIGKTAGNYTYNGEFADIAADAPEAGLVLEAVKNNIVSSANGNVFAKNSAITYNAAIKLILNALDFSVFANVGQNANYAKYAREFDLDITVKNSKSVSVVEFYEMAAIALEIPLVEIRAIEQGNPVYEINDSSNALEQYFDVYKTTGYVEANGVTALYSKKDCNEDMLRINGIDVKYSDLPCIDTLLGLNVDLYYKDRDYPEYVYHTQLDSQKILKIGSDDIQKFLNNVYTYDNGNGSNKKVKISDNCAIIYNGKAVTEEDSKYISNALFTPENGYVELLSDSSGKYKTVKIYSFDTYVVKNVYSDEYSKMLVDKYDKKNLIITDDAFLTVRDKDNKEITFDNIENGDVLSVACSYDGECVLIYACGDAVEGILTAHGEDMVTIEGEDFVLSKQLQKDESKIPSIGENVTVYLDSFDRVVAIEMHAESVWSVGLVLKTGMETYGLLKKAGCVILTAEGTVETVYAAEKYWIDSKRYDEAEKFADALKLNEVIRYKLNKDGQLFKIDTAQEVESNNTLQSAGTGSYTWRNTHSLLHSTEGDVIPVKSDATVIVNPEFVTFAESGSKAENAEFYDKDYFTSGTSFLTNGIAYNIKAYKTNADSMLADIILCGFYNYDLYMRTELTYVVNKVLTTLDEDGNKLIKLVCTGISGEKEMWDYKDRADNVYTNSIRTLKDIKPGDIVRADLANDGRVLFIFKIFDYNNREFYQRIYSSNVASVDASGTLPKYVGAKPGEYNNYSDREYYVYGDALEFADGYIRVRPSGSTRDIIFKSSDNVIIYEKNNVRRGTMKDIRFDETGTDSDKIIVAAYLSGIQTVVVFK